MPCMVIQRDLSRNFKRQQEPWSPVLENIYCLSAKWWGAFIWTINFTAGLRQQQYLYCNAGIHHLLTDKLSQFLLPSAHGFLWLLLAGCVFVNLWTVAFSWKLKCAALLLHDTLHWGHNVDSLWNCVTGCTACIQAALAKWSSLIKAVYHERVPVNETAQVRSVLLHCTAVTQRHFVYQCFLLRCRTWSSCTVALCRFSCHAQKRPRCRRNFILRPCLPLHAEGTAQFQMHHKSFNKAYMEIAKQIIKGTHEMGKYCTVHSRGVARKRYCWVSQWAIHRL